MDVTLLDAVGVRRELRRLLDQYQEVHWAVAWGSDADEWSRLIEQRRKFRNVVFGLAFAQTDPDLVAALKDVKNAYVVERHPGGTFHPKIYAFRSKGRAAAIIGSANYTAGGMSKNFEASTLFEGDATNPFFVEVFATVAVAAEAGSKVDEVLVADYRVQVSIAKGRRGPSRDPIPSRPRLDPVATLDFISTDWAGYVARFKPVKKDYVDRRLDMLDAARKIFASRPDFRGMDELQRKALAGIVGVKERTGLDYSGDWGWFGSMQGFGDLRGLVRTNDSRLAKAINTIPLQGDVTEDHYRRFIDTFERAFRETTRSGGIATASRFLAMKRPDSFLCICKPNQRAAGKDLGFAYTSLGLHNYWERVVEPMRAARWYHSPRPANGDEARLWDVRASMLDAVYYV